MDLRHATKQQVFDHVVRHLINQGRPAVNSLGRCQYRTARGLRCAVGCLIPEDQYDLRMEEVGDAINLSHEFPELGIREDHLPLLLDLQRAHDDTWGPNPKDLYTFRDRLTRVARTHFLSQIAVFISPPEATQEAAAELELVE